MLFRSEVLNPNYVSPSCKLFDGNFYCFYILLLLYIILINVVFTFTLVYRYACIARVVNCVINMMHEHIVDAVRLPALTVSKSHNTALYGALFEGYCVQNPGGYYQVLQFNPRPRKHRRWRQQHSLH